MRNGELVFSTSPDGAALRSERGKEFIVDEGKLIVALELGLKEMEAGSRACLRVSEEWGAGALMPEGTPCLNGAAVWIELALHWVRNEPAPGEHGSSDAVLAFSLEKKQQGNACLGEGSPAHCGRAVRRYQAGIQALEDLRSRSGRTGDVDVGVENDLAGDDAPQRIDIQELLTSLQLNAAQGELKRARWKEAASFCDAVLQRTEGNTKALYRRGLARAELGELRGAIEDFRLAAAAIGSGDVGVRRELARVEALQRDRVAEERGTFGGVFEKMRQKDKEKERREEARLKAEAEKEEKRKLEEHKAEREELRRRSEAERKEREEREKKEAGERSVEAQAAKMMQDLGLNAPTDSGSGAFIETELPVVGGGDGRSAKGAESTVGTCAFMPPQSHFQSHIVQKAQAVEYEVPAFLRRGGAKKVAR